MCPEMSAIPQPVVLGKNNPHRAQMQNLGIKPYTSWLKEKRAQKLAADFPRYDPVIIQRFSETDPMVILPGTH